MIDTTQAKRIHQSIGGNGARGRSGRGGGGSLGPPLSRFQYFIDFVAGTTKGGTQTYGNNNDDGRFFRDPSNIQASFLPNAAGLLVPVASAGLRRTNRGTFHYASGTTRALWNRDLTNVAWTATGVTAAKDQVGADGTANAASSILATTDNAVIGQAITQASATWVMSADIKRLVGSGTLEMSIDNQATWTVISGIGASYSQKFIVQAAITNPAIFFRIGTSGDKFAIDFVHLIAAANGVNTPNQARVTTTTAGILNSQSRPNAATADAGPLGPLVKGAFAFYHQMRSERASGGFLMTSDANLQCSVQADGSAQLSILNAVANSNVGGWRTGLGNLNKAAGFVTAAGAVRFCLNGGNVGAASGGTLPSTLTHWDLCTNGSGVNSQHGLTEQFGASPNLTFTDAELVAMTT